MLGSVELSQVTDISALEKFSDPSKGKFVFQVVTSGRTYFLCADTQEDREDWISTLQARASLSSLMSNE